MASQYRRLLDIQPVDADETQALDRVFDAGAYRQLNVQLIRMSNGAGTTVKIKLQHAAVNEEGMYMDLKDDDGSAVELDLGSGSGDKFQTVSGFLRFVRWAKEVEGLTTQGIGGVDIVAKE